MSQILVVDASIVVDLLARFQPQPIEEVLWAEGVHMAAPELLDVEVVNALRKLDRIGVVPERRRSTLIATFQALPIRKYRHDVLLPEIWTLRKNVTAYDAAYVVLARLLQAPLVTRDRKLATAPGLGDLSVIVPRIEH